MQFESTLFNRMCNFLGATRTHTTAYHPEANGMIERCHRTLKSALMAQGDRAHWYEHLSLVLLSLRAAVKADQPLSPAELTLGCPLRLPGEFVDPALIRTNMDAASPDDTVTRMRQFLQSQQPAPPRPSGGTCFIPPGLSSCTHVFLRCDRVRRPLESPYTGPYEVLRRREKTLTINVGGEPNVVSVDRVKPAYLADSCLQLPPPATQLKRGSPPTGHSATPTDSLDDTSPPPTSHLSSILKPPRTITRSGRRVHFPDRFISYSFI